MEKKEPKHTYLLPGLLGLANAFLTSWTGGLISSCSLSGVISSAPDASIYIGLTEITHVSVLLFEYAHPRFLLESNRREE